MRAYIFTYLLLLAVCVTAAGQTVPSVAWGDVSHGSFGGVFAGARSGSVFFAAEVSSATGTRSIDINVYNNSGLSVTRNITTDNCSTCSAGDIPLQLFSSPDGTALMYYETVANQPQIRKINAGGGTNWFRSFANMKFLDASNAANGSTFMVLQTNTGVYQLNLIASNGSISWTKNLAASTPNNISATSSGSVVITDADSTKLYSSAGAKVWAMPNSGAAVDAIDATTFYLYDAVSIAKYSLANGSLIWRKAFANANDMVITGDKGVVVANNNETVKFANSDGATVWSTTTGAQRLQVADDGTIGGTGVGANINDIVVFNAVGGVSWKKTFSFNAGGALRAYPGTDGGWFVTTRGVSSAKPSTFGSGFVYHLLPLASSCSYAATITPNTATSICRTGSTTFTVSQAGLDLTYGLPTPDYAIVWLRGTQNIGLNALTYQASIVGDYAVRIQQGGCNQTSAVVNLTVITPTVPSVTASLNEICAGGGTAVTLTATNCTGGTVQWSSSATGNSISVTPTATTNYTAKCVVPYTNMGVAATCESDASTPATVTVLTASNITLPNGIIGSTGICRGVAEEQTVAIGGVSVAPLTYEWKRGTTVISTQASVSASTAGDYQVTVTDKRGCKATSPVKTISTLGTRKPTLTSDLTELCLGGSASAKLTATGCNTSTTLWSTNESTSDITVSPQTTTNYSARCSDTYQKQGNTLTCYGDTSNVIKVNVLQQSNFIFSTPISSSDAVCKGGAEQLSIELGGTYVAPITYAWIKNNSEAVSTQSTATVNEGGAYIVTARDKRGCGAISQPKVLRNIGLTVPAVTASISEICLDGGVQPTLFSSNCESSSSIIRWSTNATGNSITVNPTATTAYTATCEDVYTAKDGTIKSCVSNPSNQQFISVLQKSNIEFLSYDGLEVLCRGVVADTQRVAFRNFQSPFELIWFKDGISLGNKLFQVVKDAGNYQCTLKDARGCFSQTPVKTVVRSNLKIDIMGDRIFCDGTANQLYVKADSGLGNYSYRWKVNDLNISTNDTIRHTFPGLFSVVVTDSRGCTEIDTATVVNFPKITTNFAKNVTVKGNRLYNFDKQKISGGVGAITVTLSGISDSAQPIPATDSTVGKFTENGKIFMSLTDTKGCNVKDTVRVKYVPCDVAVSITGDTLFCYYNFVTLSAAGSKGVAPLTFEWQRDNQFAARTETSTFATQLQGVYHVTLTDSAWCQVTSGNLRIREKGRDINSLIRTLGDSTAYKPFGVTINAVNQSGVTYAWFKNDSLLTNEKTYTITAYDSGTYRATVSKDGCTVGSNKINVQVIVPLGKEKWETFSEAMAFPNPTADRIIIRSKLLTPAAAACSVTDLFGRVVYDAPQDNTTLEHEWQIDAAKWPAGTYIYRIQTADNGVASGKIVKQ